MGVVTYSVVSSAFSLNPFWDLSPELREAELREEEELSIPFGIYLFLYNE